MQRRKCKRYLHQVLHKGWGKITHVSFNQHCLCLKNNNNVLLMIQWLTFSQWCTQQSIYTHGFGFCLVFTWLFFVLFVCLLSSIAQGTVERLQWRLKILSSNPASPSCTNFYYFLLNCNKWTLLYDLMWSLVHYTYQHNPEMLCTREICDSYFVDKSTQITEYFPKVLGYLMKTLAPHHLMLYSGCRGSWVEQSWPVRSSYGRKHFTHSFLSPSLKLVSPVILVLAPVVAPADAPVVPDEGKGKRNTCWYQVHRCYQHSS